MKTKILICLILLLMNKTVSSQTVTTMLRSGSNSEKLNLVIIGDGFTSGNGQTMFNDYVQDIVMEQLFVLGGPLWESMNAFNIFKVNVNSVDSGVTQIDSNGNVTTARNTALDFRYSGRWEQCWMEGGPNTDANIANILDPRIPNWTYVFVILNEAGQGGCRSGNRLAVTRTRPWTTCAHEMGHMVGNLADEYCKRGCESSEPSRINVTLNTARSTLKWRDFVNSSTPLPTGSNPGGANGGCTGYTNGARPASWTDADDAGTFEGGQYKDSCIYRPAVNCRMRGNVNNYCPPCYDKMKSSMDPYHEYTFNESYTGDFTGDGLDDIVIHNDNSLALYKSDASEIEPVWIVTGELAGWDDFMKGDRFYAGDFNGDGKDDLFVTNFEDWAFPYLGMLRSTGSGFECIRLFELELPGWDDMKPHDQFFVADFDGDKMDDLYIFNGSDWSMGYLEMLKSTGTNLTFVRRFDNNLPGWGEMRKNDKFYTGDLNNDNKKDLYIFNGPDWSISYLQMLSSTGTSLQHVHRYDRELPGWDDMKEHDQFYIADFNGDGNKDIYVFNGKDWSMEYFEMLRSTASALSYVKRFDGDIPGWGGLAPNDKFFVANLDGDKDEDCYVYNYSDWATEYLGIVRSSGNDLTASWQDNWIGNWNLGSADKFLAGDFNTGSHYEDLFIYNNDWFGLLRSSRTALTNTAIYPKWIHRHHYHRMGWW